MANGAKVALAVGAGYLLGRTRKGRLALMLAAAGITGKFPTRPGDLVAHGLKSLGGSTELGQLGEQLRGDVLGAARSAALTAVTHQVDSLNDRLQGVTSAVGADEVLDDVGGTVGDTLNLGGRPRRTRPDEDEYLDEDLDEDGTYEEPEDDGDEEPLDVDEADDDIDEDEDLNATDVDDEEAEEESFQPPVTRRRATRRASAPRASVRRSSRSALPEEPSVRVASRRRAPAATKHSTARRGR
ncbi:hypothetical protein A5685_15430 [Mycobacterium colombiense]|uniref:DNA primase n=1 Tax=Mycobacterium colombiense TaxID=339268 RepID=A0A1A2RJU5_9MYCO|nr:hypothetical protein [Mycobacterium colombiense]OBH52313.1 hypothetical protein A5685_15430 [Mycobacterium colombiense]